MCNAVKESILLRSVEPRELCNLRMFRNSRGRGARPSGPLPGYATGKGETVQQATDKVDPPSLIVGLFAPARHGSGLFWVHVVDRVLCGAD